MSTYNFYKVINNQKPVYIGCTSQKLNRRLWQHNHDYNSQVYKAYVAKGEEDLSIERIGLKTCRQEMSHSMALHYELLLTYNYGFNYELCNFNAGNSFYHNHDDEILYQYTHELLFDIMENVISFDFDIYAEIILNCANICDYNIDYETIRNYIFDISSNKLEELLNELDNICCERLCESLY